jgi:hypothetical protein
MAGTWLKLLARLRVLRGTSFDLFSRSSARRDECALANDYRVMMGEMAPPDRSLGIWSKKLRGVSNVGYPSSAQSNSRSASLELSSGRPR